VRLVRTGAEFTRLLADSGRFKIVPITRAVEKQIAAGQTIGNVAGTTWRSCAATPALE
jgi:hypothetical protein